MSGFTQHIDSPFPDANMLFDPAKAMLTAQGIQNNQLLMQGRQLDLSNANMEQVSRAAAGLLSAYPDEASRAANYPRVVGMLQSQGFAKNAPATYPGEEVLRSLAAQGVSSEKQYEYGAGRTAAQGALGALGVGNTGTGGAPGGVATTPSATIEPAAFNNATAVRDGLIKRGMDPDTATGAAANALHESVANPRTGRGDNGNAAGIFMWTGPRLQAYIDKTGHPPDGAPLDEQLDFLMSEWNGSESAAAAKIAAAQGPAAKAAAFSQYFLRPKDTTGEMQRRSATALQLQQQIGGGGTTAAATPAGGGGASGRVQVASITPTTATDGTTAPPGSTAAPDAVWDLPGAPAPDQPPAPAAAPTAATPAPAPQVPLAPMLQLRPSGLTAEQEALFTDQANRPQSLAQAQALAARVEAQIAHNQSYNAQAEEHNVARQRQAAADARQTVQDQAQAAERERVAAHQAEQLALSKKADARAEAEAKRAGLPTGYRLDDTGKAYRIDGLPPDPAVLEAQANAGKQAQRQFEQENTLRDEFQKLTSDFRIVQTSFENIRSAAKANDGAGDMSLLYNYVRLLDPTSVVRESEFAAAAASGSLGERVQTAYERIASGARMPESLRQSFIREGRNLYNNQLNSHNTVADQYEQLARDNGLEPKRVVTRFARPQDDAGIPAPKSEAEFKALPSGTVYMDPEGKQRTKP